MTGKNFSTNNTGGRRKADFYETPYSLTWLILGKEKLVDSILEPACGKGAITRAFSDFGYLNFTSYDKEKNFLNETKKYDTVITNPPYSLEKEFILKAKEISNKKILFLLPLSYLHGKWRYDNIWNDKDYPLSSVYVFTRYPMLGEPLRKDGKHNTGMMVYAWFVWEKMYKGDPVIRWLDNNQFILKRAK
jgi:hypothetical protein